MLNQIVYLLALLRFFSRAEKLIFVRWNKTEAVRNGFLCAFFAEFLAIKTCGSLQSCFSPASFLRFSHLFLTPPCHRLSVPRNMECSKLFHSQVPPSPRVWTGQVCSQFPDRVELLSGNLDACFAPFPMTETKQRTNIFFLHFR